MPSELEKNMFDGRYNGKLLCLKILADDLLTYFFFKNVSEINWLM